MNAGSERRWNHLAKAALLVASMVCAGGVSWADSLFRPAAAREGTLISDKRVRFDVGDIITVLVQETIDATTEANTDTRKESAIGAEAPAAGNPFLIAQTPGGLNIIPEEQLPNWSIDIENEHRTTGRTKRRNRLVSTVGCCVTKVYDNGNLAIEGEKCVTVNREDSKLYVSGLVRGRDITPANTVLSSQVANAVIELRGAGPLWNNQRRGILTRLLDWFSPF